MEKNLDFYYGILFYILFINVYNILYDLTASLLFLLKADIYLVLILLLLLIIGLLLLFLYMKKLPSIKLWVLLSILLLPIIINFFNLPERYFIGPFSFYTEEQRLIIFDFIYPCRSIFYYGIIGIVCFHYLRKKKQLN